MSVSKQVFMVVLDERNNICVINGLGDILLTTTVWAENLLDLKPNGAIEAPGEYRMYKKISANEFIVSFVRNGEWEIAEITEATLRSALLYVEN